MPGSSRRRAPAKRRANGGRDPVDRRLHFVRSSHIFASVVREILEVKLLREVTPHPLTLSQFHLLKLIALNGDHQIGEVATFLGVSAPAATKNIDKLERLGLIERNTSTGDRRAVFISPSAKGRQLVQQYESMKASRIAPVLEGFRQEEVDRFARFLERFSLRLIEQEDDGNGLCLRCAAYWQEDCPVGKVRGGCPYHGFKDSRERLADWLI